MKYKTLVLKKLENLDISLATINSLISQPTLTREQFDKWYKSMREKIEELETLINSEHQS